MTTKPDRKKRLEAVANIVDQLDDIPEDDIMTILGSVMAICGVVKKGLPLRTTPFVTDISKKGH